MHKMKGAFERLSPWLWGIFIATLLFALLFAFVGLQYAGSDDTPILRSFMGYEGGVPARYHLYLHTAFAWLLYGLALAFPGVAWFSLLQLFLLWFASVVIVKSMAACAARRGLPSWAGAFAGSLFLLSFAAFILCRISYTTTGALLGAAAIAQLMSVDYAKGTDGQILRGMSLSIALLLCCYCFRQIGVIPPLAFWLLALALIAILHFSPLAKPEARRAPRPLLLGALICGLCFGAFAGIRAVEIKTLDLDEYLAWQNARVQLFDYTLFGERTPDAALEEVGWSKAEFKLVANWFFMDENITTEAFETLYRAQPESAGSPLGERLLASTRTIRDFFAVNSAYLPACVMLALLSVFGVLLPSLGRRQSRWHSLAALLGLLLGVTMLFYLAYQGRLPMRAAASAIFPLAAFLFCLCFWVLPMADDRSRKTNWASAVIGVACLVLTFLSATQTASLLSRPIDPEAQVKSETIPVDLDTYALENPELLIIYDLSLVADGRLFPDTSAGIPPNLMFWGGYPARSPSWLYQLAQYGIDGNAMTARDFLRENVLVAGTDGEPWVSLMTHVQEHSDESVDWDFYDEYGYIGFFQLYEF